MNTEAAQALIERALQARTSGLFELLLGAALRLDPTIDPALIRSQWIDQHLGKE